MLEKINPSPEEMPEYFRRDTDLIGAEQRPEKIDYDRYVYLVKLFRDLAYDQVAITTDCPFLVQDVLFNTALAKGGEDLAEIARIVGKDPKRFEDLAEITAAAVNEKLWDEDHGAYYDFDLGNGEILDVHVGSGFAPLFAGIPDRSKAERMIAYLNSAAFCPLHKKCFAVPSFDRKHLDFSPTRYWRGPVWMNINWFLYHGCRRYGFHDYADWIREAILVLPSNWGFREYYDPYKGKGYGTDNFSWSAALLIDALTMEYRHQTDTPAEKA